MKCCSWLEHCIGWRSGQDGHMHHAPHSEEADRMAICIMPLTLAVRTEERKKKRNEKNTDGEERRRGGVFVSWRGGEIEITHGVAVPCRAAAIGIHERHGLLDHTNIMTLREPEEMTAGSLARHSLDSIMG